MTNVFGKTIDFDAWGQFFKYGGTAAQHMSPAFVEQKLPHLIQELGGASTGTMFQSMERAIVEGCMDQGAIRAMRQYGLPDEGKVHEMHGKISLDAGAVRGADTVLRDPSAWVSSVLRPALDAAHLTEGERVSATGRMSSNRMTGRGMAILENQDAIVEKDAEQIRRARGLDAAPDLAKTDPRLVHRAAEAQTRNVGRRAGDPVMNPLLGIENWITSGLGRLNAHLFDHVPGAATGAATGAVAGAVGAADDMGWKTWEHGFASTAKDALRLPGDAAQGLVRGIMDGVRQAQAEAAHPSTAAHPSASQAGRAGADRGSRIPRHPSRRGLRTARNVRDDAGLGGPGRSPIGSPPAPSRVTDRMHVLPTDRDDIRSACQGVVRASAASIRRKSSTPGQNVVKGRRFANRAKTPARTLSHL